jgi:hypothetical protein
VRKQGVEVAPPPVIERRVTRERREPRTARRPCNAKSPGQRGVLTRPVYDGRVEEIVAALMHRH